MQIGFDVGATKIESVILDDQGNEKHRERTDCPKDYNSIIRVIKDTVKELEKKHTQTFPVGVCHPGVHSPQSGLVKNAPNCIWIEKKPFQKDLREALGREVFCENDGNCFALSEAMDGAGKHYKIVYGIILGSGAGGGLVIDKQIVSGPNGVAGEWGHNQLPYMAAKKEKLASISDNSSELNAKNLSFREDTFDIASHSLDTMTEAGDSINDKFDSFGSECSQLKNKDQQSECFEPFFAATAKNRIKEHSSLKTNSTPNLTKKSQIYIEEGLEIEKIKKSTRVGIKEGKELLWNFKI